MSKPKIAVAMSGGVDSSVTAYLLKKQGYDVFGVFMHLWADPAFSEAENKCCSLESQQDARRVAAKLKIPLYTLNVSKYFKKNIVDDFIKQYKKGLTPNPCVWCNEKIKFDYLFKQVKKLGADYLATGHYVNLKNNELSKGEDLTKDQSYFLYRINSEYLKYLKFPLGNYLKKDVIKIAQKNKLLPESKKESQDVCFLPKNGLDIFLKKYIKEKPGKIVNLENNQRLGVHTGLSKYTIGQRGGIGVGGNGPYFVVKKDNKKNILYVTNNTESRELFKVTCKIRDVNFINRQKIKFPLKCCIKCRYGQKEIKAIITEKYNIKFQKPQRAITPGQSLVIYKNNKLIGGGIIC